MSTAPHSQRAYSIRTRIKTVVGVLVAVGGAAVREHIPLEQGLRPLISAALFRASRSVREHIPLEQGLRHHVNDEVGANCPYVREHIPLEQGLRPITTKAFEPYLADCQRAYSIRTRIKTPFSVCLGLAVAVSESIFH